MMDVVLFTGMNVMPGFIRSPGAYRIATELRDAGYTVQVIDFFPLWTREELERAVNKYVGAETIMVGFSTTFLGGHLSHPAEFIQDLLSMIRARAPRAKIVVGGAYSHMYAVPNVDFYLLGYADQMVLDLMKHIRDPSHDLEYFSMQHTGYVLDWKEYPIRDAQNRIIRWDDNDHIRPEEFLPIEVSRGCIFRCTFCSYPLNGKKKNDYVKDPGLVREEMYENYTRFGTTGYIYADDTHNDTVQKLVDLKGAYDRLPFKIEYVTYLRLDLFVSNPETAVILRDGGLTGCFFGIETLNHASGKAIGKGMDTVRQLEFLYDLRQNIWKDDVSIGGGFIIGLPHDTYEDFYRVRDFLLDPTCPFHAANMNPLMISRKNTYHPFRAAIDLYPERYGYQFNDDGWYTATMDEPTTKKLVAEFRASYDAPVAGMSYPFPRGCGFTREEVRTLPYSQLVARGLYQRRDTRVAEYKAKILGESI